MLTRNKEIQHEQHLAAVISAKGFLPAWRSLAAHDDDPNAFDWDSWKRRFVVILLALLMETAERLAVPDGLDAQMLLALYEQEGRTRLDEIAETTERNLKAEYARYQQGEITRTEFVERAQRWFSDARAGVIAEYEFGRLSAAASLELMRKLNVHMWEWIHQGTDIPCATFCRDNVGMVFTLHDPIPPAHPKCHCRAKPVTL